jgi:hypothetical protein
VRQVWAAASYADAVRCVAVDWSGAARHEDRHLWVAEVDADTRRVVALAPATRLGAVDRLLRIASGPDGMVAGLDFSFSLPAWWLGANGITSVDELWADGARLEAWLAACRPPFWGRPGRTRPELPEHREYRRTELAAPRRPRSTFQIGGAGAVGTGSLRGMPHLSRLRASGVALWPWDPWAPPVVAEVWPRLALGATVKSSAAGRAAWVAGHRDALDDHAAGLVAASDDALDAVAAALHLAGTADSPRPPPAAPEAVLEGWIDGVPDGPEPSPAPRGAADRT